MIRNDAGFVISVIKKSHNYTKLLFICARTPAYVDIQVFLLYNVN